MTHQRLIKIVIITLLCFIGYPDASFGQRDPGSIPGADIPPSPQNQPGARMPGGPDKPSSTDQIPQDRVPSGESDGGSGPNYKFPGYTMPSGNDHEPPQSDVPVDTGIPAPDDVITEPDPRIPGESERPDNSSVIEHELETDYLTAPVGKEDLSPTAESDEAAYVPSQVLVLLRGVSDKKSVIDDLAGKYNIEPQGSSALGSINATMVLFTIPDGRSVIGVSNTLASDAAILLSQPNFYFDSMSGDNVQYGVSKIRADAAHEFATGKGITVAVIDTGIDFNHPCLKNKIILKSDFVHRDMNGFTTDAHGTSVAGIIAASVQGETNMGVAPDAGIIAVKTCWSDPKDGRKAVCSSDKLAAGLDYAISNKAQIINFSLGGPKDGIITQLISRANSSGVVIVAAGGNGGHDGKPVYPAALPEVIAVSATDANDGLYALSTPGKYIDLAAPGVDIFSPAPGNSWQMVSGTSMAAAHVSGAIALLLQNYPELSPFQIKYLLGASSVDLGAPGRDAEFGEGRIDVLQAMKKLEENAEALAHQ